MAGIRQEDAARAVAEGQGPPTAVAAPPAQLAVGHASMREIRTGVPLAARPLKGHRMIVYKQFYKKAHNHVPLMVMFCCLGSILSVLRKYFQDKSGMGLPTQRPR